MGINCKLTIKQQRNRKLHQHINNIMECYFAVDMNNYYEERVAQMVIDLELQPVHPMDDETRAQTDMEAPVAAAKPAKQAALKTQTSFGRVLLAANKAINPLLSTITLGNH